MAFEDKPVFVDEWPDEKEQERYRIQAQAFYSQLVDLRRESRQLHADYGKWLVASFLAVHAGAIFVLSSLREGATPQLLAALSGSATWHCAGIVAILIAGFMAWANFQFAEVIYVKWAQPAMLFRTDLWPSDASRFNPVGATMFAAVASGGMSLFCFIAGAQKILSSLS